MAIGKKYTALIVDDDILIRNVHKKYLSKNGFEVKMAEDGLEAVEIIRAGNMFNLVLMDMDMPIMNGIEATREIRNMGFQNLIIGMSASSSDANIQEFIRAGLDDFLPTPMNMAKIAAIVGHVENRV